MSCSLKEDVTVFSTCCVNSVSRCCISPRPARVLMVQQEQTSLHPTNTDLKTANRAPPLHSASLLLSLSYSLPPSVSLSPPSSAPLYPFTFRLSLHTGHINQAPPPPLSSSTLCPPNLSLCSSLPRPHRTHFISHISLSTHTHTST